MAEAVYLLCALTSLVCAGLLLRSYVSNRMSLILWTCLCFVGLAVSNILLVIDLALVTSTDLRIVRNLAAVGGLGVLIYGMIMWEH